MVVIRLIRFQFVVAASLLLSIGCTTDDSDTINQQKSDKAETGATHAYLSEMIHEMNAEKNPQNHINNIRSYALENFNRLTSEEVKLIRHSNPKIYKSSTTLEYCFVWFLSNNGGCLEVVATPPPTCTPVAVFRRDRVYFP